jgi:hypothetical protein
MFWCLWIFFALIFLSFGCSNGDHCSVFTDGMLMGDCTIERPKDHLIFEGSCVHSKPQGTGSLHDTRSGQLKFYGHWENGQPQP